MPGVSDNVDDKDKSNRLLYDWRYQFAFFMDHCFVSYAIYIHALKVCLRPRAQCEHTS
jgi:hypothetical protein